MTKRMLKLKQASAVLQVEPKELQNLVQFRVVKPKRSEGTYYFDPSVLLVAKIAVYLKDALGTRISVLSKLMDAFTESEEKLKAQNPDYVVFTCRIGPEEDPIRLSVPLRALEERIEERMSRVDLYRDLPRGRKRRSWKKDFLESLVEAAKEIGEISEEEIFRAVRSCRRERRVPEITVAAER
jgi:MerR HTH family regulatory protein